MKWISVDQIRKDPSSWIEQIKDTDTETLYIETLRLQMEITKSEVLKKVASDPDWQSSKRVLDLGCGPGFLVKLLSDYFPDKSYSGIDLNDAFIGHARKLVSSARFSVGNALDCKPSEVPDFIHVRALLQHLPDVRSFLANLEKITRRGSSILFFDSAGSNRVNASFIPDVPSYGNFFQKLDHAQKARGGDRDCLNELVKNLKPFAFAIQDEMETLVPSTEDILSQSYFYYAYFVCELLDRIYEVPSDRRKIISELLNWLESEHRYAHFLGKWVKLVRTS